MTTDKRKQGFSLLPPERRREIASSAGKEAQRLGKAHRWTSEEARIAGSRSGQGKRVWKKKAQ